jgi:hypothetical protein
VLEDNPLMRWLWPLLASLAGAVTALSFRPFKKMSGIEIAMALFVGASFAWFVSPWVNHMIFGNGPTDIRVLGGVFYLMASGSNILIPFAIKWFSKVFGTQKEETAP